MASEAAHILVGHLRQLTSAARVDGLSDGDLVRRFAARRDEEAFAALVRRHGPMVLRVCRRVLRDVHAAEDAFQATFLILSRKAASLRNAEAVASWLYGVAYRLALKARAHTARQRMRENRGAAERLADDPLDELSVREAQAILDEELARLPEKYRAPLVLCCLEGKARDEAARQLGWPAKLVKSRLQQGRTRLHQRLTHRGLTLPAALAAALLAEEPAPAAVPIRATIEAVRAWTEGASSAGVSARAAMLAEGLLRSTTAVKVKVAMGVLFLTGALAAGAGIFSQPQPTKQTEVPTTKAVEKSATAEQPPRTDRYGDPLPAGAVARLGTIRWRHSDQVLALAFAPDGQTLASGAMDKAVHVWDVATGRRRRSFRHTSDVSCVLFTPDGKKLITLPWDKTIRLWDVSTGKELRRWPTLGGWKVALSPDGKTLAGFGEAGTLVLWDLATGAKIRELTFEGQFDGMTALAFAPDSKTIVSGGDRVLRRFDVATGKQLDLFGSGHGQTHAIAFSSDGKTLAVGSHDDATLWSTTTWKEIHKIPERWVYSLAFSPDGKRLATGVGGDTVRVWDAASGKELTTCKGRHQGRIWAVAFSPDGKTVAGGSEGSSIQLWDAATGAARTSPAGPESWIRFTRFTADGRSVLSASYDGWVRRWDIAAAKESHRFRVGTFLMGSALAPDGRTLATGGDKVIHLWDAITGKELRHFGRHKQMIAHLAFSPRGDQLASVEYRQSWFIRLWDVRSGEEVRAISTPHSNQPACLAFSSDGKTLATGEFNNSLFLFNAKTGKLIRRWEGHGQSVERHFFGITALAFSPDGKFLASAGADRTIRLWELANGREFFRSREQSGSCFHLAFSPDGKMLASAGSDATVCLWEVSSGKERHRFEGHEGLVTSVEFSADGRFLVSGGNDTTVLVWSVWPPAEGSADLTPRERDRLWVDLADADAARAWRAMGILQSNPRSALSLLADKLRPIAAPEKKRIAQLLKDLDSERFEVRAKAESELEKLEDLAEAPLRRALQEQPSSLELRRRIERLLKRLKGPITSGETLRRLRAIEVLERIASPEARHILQKLAGSGMVEKK